MNLPAAGKAPDHAPTLTEPARTGRIAEGPWPGALPLRCPLRGPARDRPLELGVRPSAGSRQASGAPSLDNPIHQNPAGDRTQTRALASNTAIESIAVSTVPDPQKGSKTVDDC